MEEIKILVLYKEFFVERISSEIMILTIPKENNTGEYIEECIKKEILGQSYKEKNNWEYYWRKQYSDFRIFIIEKEIELKNL